MNNMENEFIEKLARCAAACESCMDACLDESDVKKMVQCIRTDRDCARICQVTASFVASNSSHAEHLVKECQEICRQCAEEFEKHDMEHCQACAQACRECEEACKNYLGVAV